MALFDRRRRALAKLVGRRRQLREQLEVLTAQAAFMGEDAADAAADALLHGSGAGSLDPGEAELSRRHAARLAGELDRVRGELADVERRLDELLDQA